MKLYIYRKAFPNNVQHNVESFITKCSKATYDVLDGGESGKYGAKGAICWSPLADRCD